MWFRQPVEKYSYIDRYVFRKICIYEFTQEYTFVLLFNIMFLVLIIDRSGSCISVLNKVVYRTGFIHPYKGDIYFLMSFVFIWTVKQFKVFSILVHNNVTMETQQLRFHVVRAWHRIKVESPICGLSLQLAGTSIFISVEDTGFSISFTCFLSESNYGIMKTAEVSL